MANYRNKKLLQSANGEKCVACGSTLGVVAAHCNEQQAGKGMGMKAHDLMIAYLCGNCHRVYDEGTHNRAVKHEFFAEAHFLTSIRIAEKLASGQLEL